jgi:hypothetical protein
LGRRSRKRGRAGGTTAGERGNGPGRRSPYAGSQARNAQVRAGLEPLGPDERPLRLKVAVAIASLVAVANLVATFAVDLPGAGTGTQVYGVLQALVLGVAAWGMWGKRYWAVLGFQAVLALQILFLSLALLRVQSALLGIGVALTIAGLGAMFWSLVRLMARIQLPEQPSRNR